MDAIVVGGGAAGVAAAETAGRMGLSTLLVERYGFCAGNAVAGLSGAICGMYLSSERQANRPEQAVFGFTDRFRRAMIETGGITDPQRYGRTGLRHHLFRRRSNPIHKPGACFTAGAVRPGHGSGAPCP